MQALFLSTAYINHIEVIENYPIEKQIEKNKIDMKKDLMKKLNNKEDSLINLARNSSYWDLLSFNKIILARYSDEEIVEFVDEAIKNQQYVGYEISNILIHRLIKHIDMEKVSKGIMEQICKMALHNKEMALKIIMSGKIRGNLLTSVLSRYTLY
jgi:hypothetical protein